MGLPNSEIKAYLTLLSEGIMDAKSIYQRSGVPFGKIYEVLYSLERRGLINIQHSRPKMFIAIEPSLAIKTLLEDKETKLHDLIDQASEIEDELNKIYHVKTENSLFWTVAVDNEAIMKIHNKIFDEAKREVLIYAGTFLTMMNNIDDIENEKIIGKFTEFIPQYQDLLKRDIEIKILISYVEEVKISRFKSLRNEFLWHKNFVVRFTQLLTRPFVIIDAEKVLLGI
jgi:sugar-specific transcriptional regulator TrmB